MDLISSLSMDVVNKALDGLSKRNVAIASNLANVDTPGYNRKVVQFEDQLQHAITQQSTRETHRQASNDSEISLRATRPEHFSINPLITEVNEIQPEITEVENQAYRADGNSVDVENEMTQLAKNTGRYIALANMESRMLKSLKSVINNGGA